MSIYHFYANGLRAEVLRRIPDATRAEMAALDELVRADTFLTDDGAPHLAFIAWVEACLRRRGEGDAVPADPAPAPKPAPSSIEVAV